MTGLILAGGRSSRFGSDKTRAVLFGKEDILHRSLRTLRNTAGISSLAVSCRADQTEIFGKRAGSIARIIPDAPDGTAGFPVFGIIAALELLRGPVLVVPCDLPLLTSEVLTLLVREHRRRQCGRPEKDSLLRTLFVRDDGMLEPLVAVYEPGSLPFLRKSSEEGHRPLHSVIPPERQLAVPCPNEEFFLNMNTAAEKIRAETMLSEKLRSSPAAEPKS